MIQIRPRKTLEKITLIIFACIFLPISTNSVSASQNAERVSFPSADLDLSLFKKQKLGKAGLEALAKSSHEISGYLKIAPESRGAVILLPGVNGLQTSHLQWGEYLSDLGYTSLVVDHYGSRNAKNFKDLSSVPIIEDAVGALKFLVSQNYAPSDKVVLFGFDRGASRTLAMLSTNHPFSRANLKFAAGIAFYPNCASHRQFSAPILMLAGVDDHLITMDTCKKLTKISAAKGRDVSFHIFEDATHFFDDPAYKKPNSNAIAPLWYASNQYSSQAHSKALILVRDFLKLYLN